MREAAADLDFEEAARLRDEVKRLRATELAVVDDPTAKRPAITLPARKGPRKPNLDEMGPGVESIPARGRSTLGRPACAAVQAQGKVDQTRTHSWCDNENCGISNPKLNH